MIKVVVREPIYRMNLGLYILDSDLNTVLSTHDFEDDEERLNTRPPGTYSYRLQVPAMFVPDDYRLSIRAIRSSRVGERVLQGIENVCPFEIFDNGSPRSRASMRWTGKVTVPISWEYEHVPLEPANDGFK